MARKTTVGVLLLGFAPCFAHACWDEAARRYGVSPQLLYAVARVESRLDPAALNDAHRARTGTYDIGLMQINSAHLPRLARSGVTEADLYDPCTNIRIGASLLAEQFARHGVSWEAVGAYNAGCSTLKGSDCRAARARYAWRVYRELASTVESSTRSAPPPILAVRVAP